MYDTVLVCETDSVTFDSTLLWYTKELVDRMAVQILWGQNKPNKLC